MARKLKVKSNIYYSDEVNEDFGTINLKREPLYNKYKYGIKNKFIRFLCTIFYYVVAHPILALGCLLRLVTVENAKNLHKLKGTGFFIYSNHTTNFDMVTIPSLIHWRTKTFIIGYSDALSLKIIRPLLKCLCYVPLGDSLKTTKEMVNHLKYEVTRKHAVLIFPEAHLWSYYTKIRPFSSASFHYPAKLNAPIIPIIVTYKKPIFKNHKGRIHFIVGEPIYCKAGMDTRENKEYLRNTCYDQMVKMSNSFPQYETYNYIYKEK